MSECNCCTPCEEIQQVSTKLTLRDVLGAWKVRWGFLGRTNYRVNPGLYAVGQPDEESLVLVSANYKLTFDMLRRELTGLNLWLVILDTKGVNVWCAAGKGTFGTQEIIARLAGVNLAERVSHRTVIVPQLGAPGVDANEVERVTGFRVVYGPVRANDLKEFLKNGLVATKDMRKVTFTLKERIVLTPMELMPTIKTMLFVFGLMFLMNLFAKNSFGLWDVISLVGAVLTGSVFTPILLPVLPGRMFALKGGILGLVWAVWVVWFAGWLNGSLLGIGFILTLSAMSAYIAMNFTGSTTFTSFSGVLKEMRRSLPWIIGFGGVGVILILLNRLFGVV